MNVTATERSVTRHDASVFAQLSLRKYSSSASLMPKPVKWYTFSIATSADVP